MRLVPHPSPGDRVERRVLRELGEVDAAVEELHHEGVVEHVLVDHLLLPPPPNLPRGLGRRGPRTSGTDEKVGDKETFLNIYFIRGFFYFMIRLSGESRPAVRSGMPSRRSFSKVTAEERAPERRSRAFFALMSSKRWSTNRFMRNEEVILNFEAEKYLFN